MSETTLDAEISGNKSCYKIRVDEERVWLNGCCYILLDDWVKVSRQVDRLITAMPKSSKPVHGL